jgi:hypothetical protein
MKEVNHISGRLKNIIQEGKIIDRHVIIFSLSLLLIIAAIYFIFFGNGLFFYQENKMLFIYSTEYLETFALRPGGMLVYTGNFLAQGYFNILYGSAIMSVVPLLLCIILLRSAREFSAGTLFSLLIALVPSCALLLLQSDYEFFIHKGLGFLLIALCFLVSSHLTGTKLYIGCLLIFPMVFYLAGSYSFVWLGMMCTHIIVSAKSPVRYYFPVILIMDGLLTFFLFKEVLFFQPVDHLLLYPLFFNRTTVSIFLIFLCVYFILFPLLIRFPLLTVLRFKSRSIIFLSVKFTLITVTAYFMLRNWDPDKDDLMKVEKLVYEQDWESVIKHHERYPSKNIIEQYYYNLALSEQDQLCARLFFGSQNYGPMALTLPPGAENAHRAVYFYYTIGLIGEAHHLAFELMVQHGYTPENITLLIKTELINGNYRIARRYINVLKKTLHYKSRADKYEKMLLDPKKISSDSELGAKMRMLPESDFFIVPDDRQCIELILKNSPRNKRAFEYKIARFMLEKDLVAVGEEVKKMKAIGYSKIPRHIEEVLAALINLTKEVPDLGGLPLSSDTEQRFLQYRKDYNSLKGNKSLLEKRLTKAEKNTFWYYLQFGIVKSDFFEKEQENYTIY